MQMKHRLPRAAPIVDHRAISIRERTLRGEFCGDELQVSQHRTILCGSFRKRDQMLSWADQDVRRRLRLNVLKREDLIVLVNYFGRDFFSADFAEQAVIHGSPLGRTGFNLFGFGFS
jgi:hypothetical protein